MNTEEIVAAMGISPQDSIQPAQTRYRQRLVAHWGIRPGARVLEVGCGQGDMTAALAAAVGPSGHVEAYDIASPDYGAPVTIGEAQAKLAAGPLGARISCHLGCDVTRAALAPRSFDVLVIAHASWYFPSLAAFTVLLEAVVPAVNAVAIADWSLVVADVAQVAHLQAALIQAAIANTLPAGAANIRTLITPEELTAPLAALGFAPTTATVATTGMQDGQWEVAGTPDLVAQAALPAAAAARIRALLPPLAAQAAAHGTAPLDAFAITAPLRAD
ncbi:methyltransferase domain-containing protein [Lacticaseibacillus kribbianus]|uniref:methyltransferase domain-containing protein n=1 Tax=Lacticaseibacillus kribbianus TaxID=2926292 RepID=UPI001CD40916|nr:methyltransferase domain-containing protein [Lacticaseibacillus kribbianus]